MIRVHSKDSGTSGSIKLTVNASSILEFTLVDDKDNDLTQDEVIKYVNLPVDDKFVDASNGTVTGTHQLGDDVWCKVKFSKPGEYSFDIYLENDNAVVYTQSEKDRNINFTHRRVRNVKDFTNSLGEIIVKGVDLFLSQAGGNTYTLKVEFNGEDKVTCKTKILTKRMLFYTEIKMENPDGSGYLSSINNDISNLVDEYKSHHIELIKHFEASVKYVPNINDIMFDSFMRDLESIYASSPDNKNLDPYCIIITYINQSASKKVIDMMVFDIPVGPGEGPAVINVNNNMNDESLWHRADYPDDLVRNEWYVDCAYTMTNNVNGVIVSNSPILIPPDKCTAVSAYGQPNNYCVVHVDVSHLPAGVADMLLTVNVVNLMRGGISLKGINIICLCTKVWWSAPSLNEQNIALVHEVGHTIGMVPDGTGICLDMGTNYYTDRGHIGPHCHNGISPSITTNYTPLNDSYATCVMYGSSSPLRNRFCCDCSYQIKKIDLTKGVNI